MTDGIRFAYAAAMTLLAAIPAAAQDTWTSECDADSCAVSRAVADVESGQRVGTLLVVLDQDGTSLVGAIVPLGSAMEPGLRLIHGSTEAAVPIQVCYPDGCRGLAPMDGAALDALATADTVDLRFFAFGTEAPISVPIPLVGLQGAVAAARATLGIE